jgi:hypothetical protein
MPVLDSGWNPNDIPLMNDLNRTTPLLYPTNTVRHDQDLAERMSVPCGTRPRLKRHCATAGVTGLCRIEKRLHTNGTCKAIGSPVITFCAVVGVIVICGGAARKSYEDFLTLWKDADPDIPVYRQAKAEYAELRTSLNRTD